MFRNRGSVLSAVGAGHLRNPGRAERQSWACPAAGGIGKSQSFEQFSSNLGLVQALPVEHPEDHTEQETDAMLCRDPLQRPHNFLRQSLWPRRWGQQGLPRRLVPLKAGRRS